MTEQWTDDDEQQFLRLATKRIESGYEATERAFAEAMDAEHDEITVPYYLYGAALSAITDLRTLLSHVSDMLCAVAFTVDDERLLTLNDEVVAGLMVKDSA